MNSYRNTLTNISPADLLFGNALNLDRGIFVSSSEEQKTLPLPLSASTSKMLGMQIRLIEIHRALITEKDDAHISNSTPSEVTEFPLETYVLLEPVFTPIKRDRLRLAAQGLS